MRNMEHEEDDDGLVVVDSIYFNFYFSYKQTVAARRRCFVDDTKYECCNFLITNHSMANFLYFFGNKKSH